MNTRIQDSFAGYKFEDVIKMDEKEKAEEKKKLEDIAREEEKRRKKDARGKNKEDIDTNADDYTTPNNTNFPFTVEELVNRGNDNFYCDDKDGKGNYIGVPVSLRKTIKWAKENRGIVATMPYLIAGLSIAKPNNYLRKKWHTAYSEEYIGIDEDGVLGTKGEAIVITMHGGGILNPGRIMKAINEGLTPQGGAILTQEEFYAIITGFAGGIAGHQKISPTKLYTTDEVMERKIPEPFGRYAVWTPLEMTRSCISGNCTKLDYISNNVVLMRAGTSEHIENYFDNIQVNDAVGNYHKFKEIDPTVPQGSMLLCNHEGLSGNYLGSCGQFVAVAPEEKPITRKKSDEQKTLDTIKKLCPPREKYYKEILK